MLYALLALGILATIKIAVAETKRKSVDDLTDDLPDGDTYQASLLNHGRDLTRDL